MYIPVKNIYKYEILSSNNIKLENERGTTEETLCLLLPHQPIEVNITPDCESESLQGREEPLCNGYDTYNEVTDPVAIEGTEFIKYEDHKIKNEAATIDKGTVKGITKNCITYKRSVNNSVYDGIIKEKFSECTCAYSDVTIETLVENTSSENKLPVQKEKKLVCEYCNKRFTCNCLKRHISFHANMKKKLSKVCYS
ncbi:uncharacterized protein LOC142317419 [Lycorma delicatula]|uniref:uncharacterized protein LOC142317419 n=1 Tax=Lycorma delicatula TaxID=130591 RepID=UPI003F514FEE